MSDNEEELSEDELDSLLADLEGRASSGASSSAAAADDDEDLESFLSRLETESSDDAGASVATAERDEDLAAQFAELDNLQPDDLPARREEKKEAKSKKKGKKKGKKKEKSAGEEGEKSPSRAKKIAKVALRGAVVALPVVALVWLVGAFLANWVSAGWLIAIIALVFALGVPALVGHYVKKGKFSWWAAGAAVFFTVLLTVPMPDQAGETLERFGHWPATTVTEIAGWEADNGLVQLNARLGGLVGGLLYSGAAPEPSALGTEPSQYGDQEAEAGGSAEAPEDGAPSSDDLPE